MSLVQLESFVAVAEEGHVGRAAQRLHVTQPPLSRRIRALEDELGVPLFVRTARGMELAPDGHRLLDHARAILARVAAAQREFSESCGVVPSDRASGAGGTGAGGVEPFVRARR